MSEDYNTLLYFQCRAAGLAPVQEYRAIPGRMFRCGKKAAGRLLDGREWNEFPEATK